MIVDFLNALVILLNFVVIPATAYGAMLALGALGVTLIYGILRFSNFAHGDTMAFGTGITILATWALQAAGISFGPLPTALLALPVGILVTIGVVLLTDRAVYRFYRKQRAAPVILVIASVGVMFVMNAVTRFVIGPGEQVFADGVALHHLGAGVQGGHRAGRRAGLQGDAGPDHRHRGHRGRRRCSGS